MPRANRVELLEWDDVPLSREETEAIVDIVYSHAPGAFRISGEMEAKHRKYHGLQTLALDGVQEIYLNPKAIAKVVRGEGKCYGGNITKCKSGKFACGIVLVHELQHANQSETHDRRNRAFWGLPFRTYKGRACEREARQRADDMREVVAAVLKIPGEQHRYAFRDPLEERMEDLRTIADVFAETGGTVSRDDVRDELTRAGLNNPVYFARLRKMLGADGVEVS